MNNRQGQRIKTWSVVVFAIMGVVLCSLLQGDLSSQYNRSLGWLGLAILLYCVFSWRWLSGKYLSLLLMVEVSAYFLTAGQTLLYAFGIPLDSSLDLYAGNDADLVNRAYIYSFLCLMLFHLGALGRYGMRIRVAWGKREKACASSVDYTEDMIGFGWILLAVTIVPYGAQCLRILIVYRTLGYAAAFSSLSGATSWSKLFYMLADYFVFSLLLLLVASKNRNKAGETASLVGLLVVVAFNLLVGNRSEPICYLIALLWLYRNYAQTELARKATNLAIAGAAVLFALIIPVIGATRNTGTLNAATVIDSLQGENSAINALKNTVISLGWSAFPLVKTMELIPASVPYHYGQSYFFALLSVVPNLLGGTHIAVQYAGLPAWLQSTLNLGFGPGYSFPAEAYYNFGWAGCLLMLPFGAIARKLLNEEENRDDRLKTFLKLGLFVVLFSIPRREMLTAVRDSVYLVLFVYWGVKAWRHVRERV